MLIQVFISVRSERQLVEQIRSSFSKNRDRLLEHRVVENFFTEVMTLADKRKLLSKDHFSVDGTLIQAEVSHFSFLQDPEQFNDDLLHFLAHVPSR